MFGLGWIELLIVAAVAIALFFWRLPEVVRSLERGLRGGQGPFPGSGVGSVQTRRSMTHAPKRRWSYRRWVQSMFVDDDDGIPRMQWNRSTVVLTVFLAILGLLTFLAVWYVPLATR